MKRHICQIIVTPFAIPFLLLCGFFALLFLAVNTLSATAVWIGETAQGESPDYRDSFTGPSYCPSLFYMFASSIWCSAWDFYNDVYRSNP